MRKSSTIKTLALLSIALSLLISALACINSGSDEDAIAQAIDSTQQVLNLQSTQVALQATQESLADQAEAPLVEPTANDSGQNDGSPSTGDGQVDSPERYTFSIINQADYSLCTVFFSPESALEWFEEDSISIEIPPGYYQEFYIDAAVYDILLVDCLGNPVAEEFGVDVPEYTSWTFADESFSYVETEPLCGDGFCGDFENSGNCPQDCQSVGPTMIVSQATLCRYCPTTRCDAVGDLQIGEETNVVARGGNVNEWFVVENYGVGGTCWIWGGHATIYGDLSLAPIRNWYE